MEFRFNGPARCNREEEIKSDLTLMRAILNSSKSKRASSTDSITSLLSGTSLHQLPNTVSISFKGIKADALVHLLANKVKCNYLYIQYMLLVTKTFM